jgi:RNA polymerase subunit RPABC4/transcription elongation factor Spt4
MKTSTRECPNCLKLKHTYYGCDVMVVPHYKSHVRTSLDPMSLSEHYNLVITETFICPVCGEKITNDYTAYFTQEDMQTMVDREVASRSK